MSRIFISYKRVDKEKVYRIKDRIESALGEKCWIDLDSIESNAIFETKIINAINDCRVFLFAYSKAHTTISDFENDWTIRELNFAAAKKKNIVFINIDNAPLTDWFEFRFGMKQQVDGMSDESVARLLHDMSKWLEVPQPATSPRRESAPVNKPRPTSGAKLLSLPNIVTKKVFSDQLHPLFNMGIACQLFLFGLIFLMTLWTFLTGCLAFYHNPQVSHVMLLLALGTSIVCTTKIHTRQPHWIGAIIVLDFIEIYLISHLGEYLFFNWSRFSDLPYPSSIRYQLLYSLGEHLQYHKIVGTHIYLIYIAVAHSILMSTILFGKKTTSTNS